MNVVPALGDPRRERPPDVYCHVFNVPTHLNVKLPAIGGHLPNADADSHLLVVRTCYNRQCKQMPRFGWSFQPKIPRGTHAKLLPTVRSNFQADILWPQAIFHIESNELRDCSVENGTDMSSSHDLSLQSSKCFGQVWSFIIALRNSRYHTHTPATLCFVFLEESACTEISCVSLSRENRVNG